GGPLAHELGYDINQLRKFANKLQGVPGTFQDKLAWMIDNAREIIGITEVGPRLAEFAGAMQHRGWDRAKLQQSLARGQQIPLADRTFALNASQDVTLNFRRMGAIGQYVNTVVPFFNVSIEAPDKFLRHIIRHPWRTAARAAVLGGLSFLGW